MRHENSPKFLRPLVENHRRAERRKIIAEFCQDIERRVTDRRDQENAKIQKWFEIFERVKTGRG